MTTGIATVEVRIKRGTLVVQGLGRTTRGQRYIKKAVPITSVKMSDKKFKDELAAAVTELLD